MSTEEKNNYTDLIKGGTSLKEVIKTGGDSIAKMQAVSNQQFQSITLPSKGWTYPEGSVLSTGVVKIKYPTGRDQALLSSQALQKRGTMIQQFLSSLIIQDFKIQDLLISDKNYFMFMARVMTYGKQYSAQVQCSKCSKHTKHDFDLQNTKVKETPQLFEYDRSTSSFEFKLPISGKTVFFSLNDGKKEKIMENRIRSLKNPNLEVLIRTAVLVNQIDGKKQFNDIYAILKDLPSRDTLALRTQVQKFTPDIDINYQVQCSHCYNVQEVQIPLTVDFFWPNHR